MNTSEKLIARGKDHLQAVVMNFRVPLLDDVHDRFVNNLDKMNSRIIHSLAILPRIRLQ